MARTTTTFRNRPPLFVVQVDPEKRHVIRATEKALLPERGVMLGNFGAAAITPQESWVTDAEFISRLVDPQAGTRPHPRGADGTVWQGRVKWSRPNRLVQALGWLMMGLMLTGTSAASAQSPEEVPPWKTNPPIVTVKKELYRQHTRPREAPLAAVYYVGPKLERREMQAEEVESDVGSNVRARWSTDNGRTWTEFVPVQPSNNVNYGGVTVWEGEGAGVFDPCAGVLVQVVAETDCRGGLYHCFTYSRYSRDQGRTWSEPQQLRYEDGAVFDPQDPKKAEFLDHNEGYCGNNLLVRTDGTLVHVLAHCNAPGDPRNNQRPWRMGSVVFLGAGMPTARITTGRRGARRDFSRALGTRSDGAGSRRTGGRAIVGRLARVDARLGRQRGQVAGPQVLQRFLRRRPTLTPPAVWKYDDGSDFYSPSSIHRMIRHSVTGKLYWLGNICPTPPSGNSPRYPLVIAEVDEAKAALKKATVTVDRRSPAGPGRHPVLEFLVARRP